MDRGDAVARFAYGVPSLDSYWRAIILFGQNVASYKFALAGALLEIGAGSEEVSLDDLALPFASRVAAHLRTHDKQGTFQQSRFLDACRAFNRGELDAEGLRMKTAQLGFANVIDAFHVVDQAEVPERFFIDERKAGRGIRLTDALHQILDEGHGPNLGEEVEARWRLVETAWELNLPRHLLTVEFEPVSAALVVPRRRTNITGARAALNGYQKGHCFYCYSPIDIASGSATTCHVDHVFPWSAGPQLGPGEHIDRQRSQFVMGGAQRGHRHLHRIRIRIHDSNMVRSLRPWRRKSEKFSERLSLGVRAQNRCRAGLAAGQFGQHVGAVHPSDLQVHLGDHVEPICVRFPADESIRQLGHATCREHVGDQHRGCIEPVPEPGDHLGRQHGIATEGEEVVVDADPVSVDAQNLGDYGHQRRFQCCGRCPVLVGGRGLGVGQLTCRGLPVDLAADGERYPVGHNDDLGNHLRGNEVAHCGRDGL
jgi:hypothetical protein